MERDELPEYLRDAYGPFVRGHFRGELDFRGALASLFALHNESANVWSHIAGFFLMMYLLLVRVVVLRHGDLCPVPRWPHAVYLIGSMGVLLVSSMAHLTCCMGRAAYRRAWRADYVAIAVGMWTMYVPWCWYSFYSTLDAPHYYRAYLTASGALAAVCVAIGSSDAIQRPSFHALQPLASCLLGVSGLVPVIHTCARHCAESSHVRAATGLCATQLLLNGLGAALFSARAPERWVRPIGRLDLVGHSHSIMHVLVVAAFVCYDRAAAALREWRCMVHVLNMNG